MARCDRVGRMTIQTPSRSDGRIDRSWRRAPRRHRQLRSCPNARWPAVTYRGYNTADWEFTNMYQGRLTHVLDRGFIVTPGRLGYAIELYGPDTGWSAVRASVWEGLLTHPADSQRTTVPARQTRQIRIGSGKSSRWAIGAVSGRSGSLCDQPSVSCANRGSGPAKARQPHAQPAASLT